MAAIHELLSRVEDEELRARLEQEIDRMTKHKKFGLVFEEHIPECTPLYDIPVKRGSTVAKKAGEINTLYKVLDVTHNDTAICINNLTKKKENVPISDLVCVAEFGEPIYPYLKEIDYINNAEGSDLWHTLIEADNYHALQLLEYLYAEKVDCIYIDPPYNSRAKDWKYNNDYVDLADSYRHSKWLSMMERRLKIAKKLLNPVDSVLIVTIDEKEYLHLGCLLEGLFPDANIQMVSTVINPQGVQRHGEFARVDEYIFFVSLGNANPALLPLSDEWRRNAKDKRTLKMFWSTLMRAGSHSEREHSPNCFYPIFVTKDGKHFVGAGEPLPFDKARDSVIPPEGCVAIWPIRQNGTEGVWQHSRDSLLEIQSKGYVRLGRFSNRGMAIYYLAKGEINKVESGIYEIEGYREDGSVISNSECRNVLAGTQWKISTHDATRYGTQLIKEIFQDKRFAFPKSLYAVHDTLRFFVADKPDALIVDFFAGSGTTLHAVNLLNAEDGGKRRCIMVTNNEVSDKEAKSLLDSGVMPEDEKWNNLGIARYVTWPRTICSIKGRDINGNPLKGTYYGHDIPMENGFEANAVFFKLGFLDKTLVSLGKQLVELIPVLWMKAGAKGKCPKVTLTELEKYWISNDNHMAILTNTGYYLEFSEAIKRNNKIETVYIITDYEAEYRTIRNDLNVKNTYQLYKDYLDNFRINQRR